MYPYIVLSKKPERSGVPELKESRTYALSVKSGKEMCREFKHSATVTCRCNKCRCNKCSAAGSKRGAESNPGWGLPMAKKRLLRAVMSQAGALKDEVGVDWTEAGNHVSKVWSLGVQQVGIVEPKMCMCAHVCGVHECAHREVHVVCVCVCVQGVRLRWA